MNKRKISAFMITILVGSGFLLSYSIFKLGIFSAKITIPAFVLLLLIIVTVFIGLKSNRNWVTQFTRVITSILSILFLVISLMTIKGNTFLADLFNSNYEDHVVSFIVLKDRPEENFEDLIDLRFSANLTGDTNTISKVDELVEEKFSSDMNVTYFEGYTEVLDRFYTGADDVFILAEAQRGIVKELYPGFDDDTRVIDTVSYRVSTESNESQVDVENQTFSIFVTGIDTFGPVSTVSRSDVNMIVTVNPITNEILLTNLPRDTQVELATFGKLDKLTHAGVYGVNESIMTLENFLDINIDYYIKVNFNSLIDIVDAMGGVEVESKFRFENGDFIVEEGINHLDGTQALIFARARYNLPDLDNDRILNHQALMTGIINKLLSPTILTNYNSILESIKGSFEFSMPENEFKSLLKMQIDSNSTWKIVSNTVMGEEIWSDTTYSMPGHNLYLVDTYPEDLVKAKSYFLQIYSNKRLGN